MPYALVNFSGHRDGTTFVSTKQVRLGGDNCTPLLTKVSHMFVQSVDDDLKRACELSIVFYTSTITRSIHGFMQRLDGTSKANEKGSSTNTGSDVSTPLSWDGAIDVENAFTLGLRKTLPDVVEALRLYLGGSKDGGTVSILSGHIHDRVIEIYVAFRKAAETLPSEGSSRTFISDLELRQLINSLC